MADFSFSLCYMTWTWNWNWNWKSDLGIGILDIGVLDTRVFTFNSTTSLRQRCADLYQVCKDLYFGICRTFSSQRWNFWNFLHMRKMSKSKSWSSNQPCAGQSVSLLSNGGSQVRPPPWPTYQKSQKEKILKMKQSCVIKPIWKNPISRKQSGMEKTTRIEMRSDTYSIWLTLASAFAIWLGLGNWDIGYWGIR